MTDLAADETQCALAEGRGYFPRAACRVIDVLVDRTVAIRTNGHGCRVEESQLNRASSCCLNVRLVSNRLSDCDSSQVGSRCRIYGRRCPDFLRRCGTA